MTTMTTRSRSGIAAIAMALLTALPLSAGVIAVLPQVASADCGGHGPIISKISDARGTTFVGTFVGGEVLDRGVRVEWDVDDVYAGEVVRGGLTFQSSVCDWMFLEPGARYLFSTGAEIPKKRAAYADTLVWRLDADAVGLAAFQDQLDPPNTLTDVAEYPAAAQAVTTLDEALALVLPGYTPPPSPPAVLLGADYGTGASPLCGPDDGACVPTGLGSGYVVVHTSTGDLIVTLLVDADGHLTASDPEPLPSIAASPSPSPSPGV